MEVWLILVLGFIILVVVVLPFLYTRGIMQHLPLWTGLHYSQDFKPSLRNFGLKGYEKVQIVEENPEGQTKKQTMTYELQSGKTLWDWFQLLLIPVVIAIVTFSFNASQASTNQNLEQQNNQEQVVNTYINQMSDLLLKYHLHESQLGDPIRAIAQAITLTALSRLDSEHKNIIILFLYRADLLKYHYYKHGEKECIDNRMPKNLSDEQPIITLSLGNLEGVTINHTALPCIDLHNMHLEGSNFSWTVLDRAALGLSLAMNADFSHTSMKAADLYYLDLSDANLQEAKLQYANMQGICLPHARLVGADLQHADLRVYLQHSVNKPIQFCGQHNNAILIPANLSDADLTQANLTDADLTQANLTGADLTQANLTGADLSGANLSGTNLDKTVLKGARYNSNEILVKDSHGKYLIDVLPTTWPQGFNPKAAGATENNTLSGANLSGASLNDANLWGADLSGANLSNAKITQAQLVEAVSLKSAIMPDGSKHP
jgi:uncharacterized protein YjbI with pentapeptide repeats